MSPRSCITWGSFRRSCSRSGEPTSYRSLIALRENSKLREQMMALGYLVPERRVPFEMPRNGRVPDMPIPEERPPSHPQTQVRDSKTAQMPGALSYHLFLQQDAQLSDSSRILQRAPEADRPSLNHSTDLDDLFSGTPSKRRRHTENEPLSPRQRLMPPPPRPQERHLPHSTESIHPKAPDRSNTSVDNPHQLSRIEAGSALLDKDVQPHANTEGILDEHAAFDKPPDPHPASIDLRSPSRSFMGQSNAPMNSCRSTAREVPPQTNSVPHRNADETVGFVGRGNHRSHQSPPFRSDGSFSTHQRDASSLYTSQMGHTFNILEAEPESQYEYNHQATKNFRPQNRAPFDVYTASDRNAQCGRSSAFRPHIAKRTDPNTHSTVPQAQQQDPRWLPTTPSPRKRDQSRLIANSNTVTSPFYNPSSEARRPARLKITDRQQSSRNAVNQHQHRASSGICSPNLSGSLVNHYGPHGPLAASSQSQQAYPARHVNAQELPSQQLLAPSLPRDAQGLFQWPDMTRPPTSPYFQQPSRGSTMRDPIRVRPNPFSGQRIPRLMPTTPSVRSNTYAFPTPTASRMGASYTNPVNPAAGARSGKSRPSREWKRAGQAHDSRVMSIYGQGSASNWQHQVAVSRRGRR